MNCLIESQKKLLDHNYRVETKIWLLKYKTDFQDIIEIILKKQIKKYSVLTALKTGIIPFPIMDTIIVFYYNLKIFKISSMMFNIKLNFIESVYLLTRIFINTAIAGELQKGTEKITTNTIDYLKESDFADVTTKFFGPLNAIAPKIAESAANFLFTYRLGLKTLKLFKPITETLK
jgi:uncharacterized membrane protein YcjF (UPF0283 family)